MYKPLIHSSHFPFEISGTRTRPAQLTASRVLQGLIARPGDHVGLYRSGNCLGCRMPLWLGSRWLSEFLICNAKMKSKWAEFDSSKHPKYQLSILVTNILGLGKETVQHSDIWKFTNLLWKSLHEWRLLEKTDSPAIAELYQRLKII